MPSVDRDISNDRESLKRQHSFTSDTSGRSIPMWDSSDPDRAPPPLPLNPGSPKLTTRANTSAAIANAAKALEERARESATASSYTTNRMESRSPERSLIKGAQHRRMQSLQSLQTGSVRDLRSYLDGARTPRSPERSPERPMSRSGTPTLGHENEKDRGPSSPDKGSRCTTPTPAGRDLLKDTPALRPSVRSTQRAILGENTPPSATMLALQTMPARDYDPPLSNITNGANIKATTPSFDALSSQLMNLISITTNLQREMAQLSRRSKDNATDLISLKEATNSRDEDIRKSLKELVQTVSKSVAQNNTHPCTPDRKSRISSTAGSSQIDMKTPFQTPPPGQKQFTLPGLATPSTFLLDERIDSPNPYSIEGAASVAMLEKIIREMVTKDGQERLLNHLSTLLDKTSQESSETAKKVAELVGFIREGPNSQALVPRGGAGDNGDANVNQESGFDPNSGPLTRTTRDVGPAVNIPSSSEGPKPYSSPKAADFVSAEMLKLLKKIKDSVTESGCMTAETKSLVRELRGEVLGMGRELGRKIDEANPKPIGALAIEDGRQKEDIGQIVREGIAELKEQMERVLRGRRRASSASVVSRATVDSSQIYDVVKQTLAERGLDVSVIAPTAGLDKDAILDAVKEAYEAYKPEIELQQFGLERDEILECLKEGLEDYRSSRSVQEPSVTKDEVVEAIQEALQHIKLPAPVNEFQEMRDELLAAVRGSLEELKPTAQMALIKRDAEPNLTKEAVLDAVKEGLAIQGSQEPREIEINRDDLIDAVKTGLEHDKLMSQLQEIIDDMRAEFKAYSSASGRDTEQVLDALKDGLESLRSEVESYVDRAQDVTSKDEIIDTIRGGLDTLRMDVEGYVAAGPQGDNALPRSELLAYIKSEFEHLQESINNQIAPQSQDKAEMLNVMHQGFEALKANLETRGLEDDTLEEMQEAMKQEFEQLQETIMSRSELHKDEVLEALHEGLKCLEAHLATPTAEASSTEEMLKSMRDDFEHLRETLATTLIRAGGSSDKEDIIDGVREMFDGLRTQLAADQGDANKETLGAVQQEIENLRQTLSTTLVRGNSSTDKDEILDVLRRGFEEVRTAAAHSQLNPLNEELLGVFRGELEILRQSIANNLAQNSSRADTDEIIDTVRLGIDDLRSDLIKKIENPERSFYATGEILDTLNDGLDGLRDDVSKMADRPVDMTVSYEILDTLKEGIASLRADIDLLKRDKESEPDGAIVPVGTEMVLADPEASMAREVASESDVAVPLAPQEPSHPSVDIERMEVLLLQLQRRVESMDSTLQNYHAAVAVAAPVSAPIPAPASPPASVQAPEPTPEPPSEKAADLVSEIHSELAPEYIPAPASVDESLAGAAFRFDLMNIEELLKDLQASVNVMASQIPEDGIAKKEDTEAIETVLHNMKAKLDELLPDPDALVSRESIEAVEAVVRATNEAIESLSTRLSSDSATKEDVAVVEVLVQEVKTGLDEFVAARAAERESQEQVTKTDISVIGLLCDDIKIKIDQLAIPDAESLPSKADVEQLIGLIHDFRDSHDKLKDSYETDIAVTAKAFDDRKKEAEDFIERLSEVKAYLGEVKDELKMQIEFGGDGITTLTDNIKSLEETIGANFSINADVKELMEIVNREFERAHGDFEGAKLDQDEKASAALEKQEEIREAIVIAFNQKLDDRFDVLMSKYDDAALLAEEQTKKMEEKAIQQEEVLAHAKAMAEELRLTVDTLGMSITSVDNTFKEISEKMSNDAETVFNKIDSTLVALTDHHEQATELAKTEHVTTRVEVTQELAKEHQLTRELSAKEHSLTREESVKEHQLTREESTQEHQLTREESTREHQLTREESTREHQLTREESTREHQLTREESTQDHQLTRDEIAKAISELGSLQGKVMEYHPQFMDSLKEVLSLVGQHYEQTQLSQQEAQSRAQATEELEKARAEEFQRAWSSLPALLPPPPQPVEKYDDTALQAKVDKLIGHAADSEKTFSHLDRLDQIHQQVMTTAAEISEFVAAQTRLITEGHESREREAEELALQIERRLTQREQLDTDIQILSEEKESLKASIAALQTEREALAAQKMRLTADVSSLETALNIRREELQVMDVKADALEKRILEGIMNHSRALLITKSKVGNKDNSKRVASNASHSTLSPLPAPSAAVAGVQLALKKQAARRSAAQPNSARRILSLSQITSNVPNGAAGFAATTNNSLKRSHSVKTQFGRKSSWHGRRSVSDVNKENETLSEESEEEQQPSNSIEDDADFNDLVSETGTERRHTLETESSLTYGAGSYAYSESDDHIPGAESMVDSEYTYGTGSYITGSELSQTLSYEPSLRSTLGDEAIEEESEGEHDQESEREDHDDQSEDVTITKGMVLYSPPSDSGLGSDLHTALVPASADSDYFRRIAEEEANAAGN